MKSFKDFCEAIKKRESNNKYDCINNLGYMGAYQFGMARLSDFGVSVRKNNNSKNMSNKNFKFIPLLNRTKFLNSPALQDFIFWQHIQDHKKFIKQRFNYLINKDLNQCKITISGCISVCHLLGRGGLINFLTKKTDNQDAFGTKASDYMKLFAEYEIL